MSDQHKVEIDALIERGKLEEAKIRLKEILMAPTTPEERAAAQLLYAKLYMDVMNRLNKAHLAVVDTLLEQAKELKADEKSFEREVAVVGKREELKKAYGI